MELTLIFIFTGATVAYMIYTKVQDHYIPVVIPLIVLLCLAYPIYDEMSARSVEKAGTEVVKDISGNKKGYLHCQRFFDAYFDAEMKKKGYVNADEPDKAVLKRGVCKDLNSWLESDKKNPTLQETTAVAILIHESMHVTGEYNESITECETHRRFVPTVMKFRVSEKTAEKMKQDYVENVYKNMPSKYQHSC